MPDFEFGKDMTVGQIVDHLADQYFAQGADALTANLLALQDVSTAFCSFAKHAVEMVSFFLCGPGHSSDQEGGAAE